MFFNDLWVVKVLVLIEKINELYFFFFRIGVFSIYYIFFLFFRLLLVYCFLLYLLLIEIFYRIDFSWFLF